MSLILALKSSVGCPLAETDWYILCDQAKAVALWENTEKCPLIHTKMSATILDANPDYQAETVHPRLFSSYWFITMKKEIEEDTRRRKDLPCSWQEGLMI